METQDSIYTADLSPEQFTKIRRLVYEHCGINLTEGKEGLVRSRLTRRLKALGIQTFDEYLGFVQAQKSAEEMSAMIDVLTTNKTSFFREPRHFDYLKQAVLPSLRAEGRSMKFWSAGCSSGEEPYTLAMVVNEYFADGDSGDCRILATDICSKILAKAREGVYNSEIIEEVPPQLKQKYFTPTGAKAERVYSVTDKLRDMIRFARLNLMGDWPMRGPFDVIFCRNVMIYFDKPTQAALVHRFWKILKKGGYLFIGHSESLAGSIQDFTYVQPATYQK